MGNKFTRLVEARRLVNIGTLSAPDSFVIVSVTKLVEVCNGCGTASSWFDYVPDKILGANIKFACFIHDWEYYSGSSKKDKVKADKNFKVNLLTLIRLNTTNSLKIQLSYYIACAYYLGVKHFGYKSFWRGKNDK